MILRARIVVPIIGPPIDDGAIRVKGGRVVACGRYRDLTRGVNEELVEFGRHIVLPGLVNAHCHLAYTRMAGQIAPSKSFADWIKAIVSLKSSWTDDEFGQSWLRGVTELLHHGATTVADAECMPALLPNLKSLTPLRVISFLEVLGIRPRRKPQEYLQAVLVHANESVMAGHQDLGLSPHAPYSTTPELLRLCGAEARRRNWRLMTHVAESAEEFQMFQSASGLLYEWLKDQRDVSDCGKVSPVKYMERHGLLDDKFIAIHANYLARGDAEILGRSGASVVHCPRSHAFFQHQAFPFEELRQAGVNICLGTDSLVTVRRMRNEPLELDMFAEMRTFAAASLVSAPAILEMATTNAAQALGMESEIGKIAEDSRADIIAIPASGALEEACEEIVNYTGKPAAVMLKGQWVVKPSSDAIAPHACS